MNQCLCGNWKRDYASECETCHAERMRFYDWMQEVAKQFLARTGIDLHDLPDLSYRDWFDTGMGMEAAINNIELEFS